MQRPTHLHQPQTGGGSPAYETVFVARQPVFEKDLSTWGYALLYRHTGEADTAVFSDDFDATLRVVANAPLCPDTCAPDKRVIIRFPERSILGSVAHALPPETTVVLAQALESPAPGYLEALTALKRDGYLLALDGTWSDAVPPRSSLDRQMALADILCLDLAGQTPKELADLVRTAERWPGRLLARRVEDQAGLDICRDLGFSLFQGFFFKKPQTLATRKISALEESRFRLLGLLEREEPEYAGLTQAIEADVSLTYRLLAYLNSASFGFGQRVSSIRQAVLLAGWKPIRAWLRLLLMTDMLPAERTRELAYLSAQRARFLELAAPMAHPPANPEALFLLGLFSLLEPIFNMPMEHLVGHLPLAPEVGAALCGEDTPFSAWLALVQATENSDWDAVRSLTKSLGLTPRDAAQAYQDSLNWADCFFGLLASTPGATQV
ncbi:MAG TPA: metal-dependent hydrolase [Desulfovibrio sp.]|jgi:EAL and modified HD-GYP domain-containing signal transduction protein|nr:metal-dependent hydrolase [Desulfovibrio sp.]